ncbi:hypothetical protein ACFFX1_11020 [Dactylosporangium sucinum]|uniref:Ribbon-helix-helix protein CopG domain-containing protein n=1 Tax=Dactylosporangium sucinum TaxID=1424081 RepID=A0A917THJ9_9ACTN|nr:hypothetical protein [Dactylosporangium sucinum]GGM22617.1 hypothetical protein GCM10007977_024730 [Dactylosporangium sucinum]
MSEYTEASRAGEADEALRDAQAAVVAGQVHQAMTDGTLTFSDLPPDEAARVLAELPPAEDLETATVPTSVRLPVPVHKRLRAYAEDHGTTASTLIRQWVEQMLAVPDRPISLADAVRALSTLPAQDQDQGRRAA